MISTRRYNEQTHWNHENNKLSFAQGQQDPSGLLPIQLELALQHCDVEAWFLSTKKNVNMGNFY